MLHVSPVLPEQCNNSFPVTETLVLLTITLWAVLGLWVQQCLALLTNMIMFKML